MKRSKMEVQLNEDIREYKDRLIWGLTGRQLLCGAIALVFGALAFLLGNKFLGANIAGLLCTFATLPFIAIGFYKWHGLPLEQFLLVWYRGNVKTPRFLPFRPDMPECIEAVMDKDKGKEQRPANKEKKKERKKQDGKIRKTENA